MVDKGERRWVWWYAAVLMLLTTLPYLIAFWSQGDEWVFSGFLFGIEDGNSYLAKMMTGYSGDWLFRSSFTTFPQRGLFVNQVYLLLGKLTAPPAQHAQMVALFHILRLIAAVLACFASYDFIAVFVKDVRMRRWALTAATLGGGLGWFLLLVGKPHWLDSLPLGFYSPETFGFLAYYGLPHLVMARAFLLWGLAAYISPQPAATARQELFRLNRRGLRSGLLWLGLGLMQPMTMLIAWGVLAVHLAITGIWAWGSQDEGRKGMWRGYAQRGGWAVLISATLLVYTVYSFSTDPFAQVWTGQNYLPSPHPLHYLVAFGWLLPWAVWGAWRLLKHEVWQGWLLAGWLLALPVWVYLPVNVQRRLAEGAWVALVMLAGYGLMHVNWRRRLLCPLVIVPTLITSVVLLAGGISLGARPAEPVFIPAAEAEFLGRVAEVVAPHDIVLASYASGNLLPAWAPVRVLVGHGPESIDLEFLQSKIAEFYSAGTENDWRRQFLRENGVLYVVVGPRERALGEWDPGSVDFLKQEVFQGEYFLYKVVTE